MKRIFKLITVCSLVLASSTASLFAQQITKFGVVDTDKVYKAYFANSEPVRNYEAKKAQFTKEIDSLTKEIKKLNEQKVKFRKEGKDTEAVKIEQQITKKKEYLTEYTAAKNAELESIKENLRKNNSFYKKLYETLAHVAESGGYSMVLSLQDANAVLWYSPSVDLTEDVISELGIRN